MTTTETQPAPGDTDGTTDAGLGIIDISLLASVVQHERPALPGKVSASFTHGWRALLKIKHVPEQLFDVTVFPVMMLLMFTYLFGGAIEGSTREYLQFFLPGILVSTVLMITMYTGMGLNIDAEKGVFDRFRSLPMWRPSAIIGALLGDAVRYSVASLVIITLGLAMGFRPDGGGAWGMFVAVGLLLVFSFSLSWVWTTIGLLLRTEKAVMSVSMMIMFPLTFLSNVFVDPETMPGWLERAVDFNPVTILVTAVRGLMHGETNTGDITLSLVVSALFVAAFAPLTMRLYRTKS